MRLIILYFIILAGFSCAKDTDLINQESQSRNTDPVKPETKPKPDQPKRAKPEQQIPEQAKPVAKALGKNVKVSATLSPNALNVLNAAFNAEETNDDSANAYNFVKFGGHRGMDWWNFPWDLDSSRNEYKITFDDMKALLEHVEVRKEQDKDDFIPYSEMLKNMYLQLTPEIMNAHGGYLRIVKIIYSLRNFLAVADKYNLEKDKAHLKIAAQKILDIDATNKLLQGQSPYLHDSTYQPKNIALKPEDRTKGNGIAELKAVLKKPQLQSTLKQSPIQPKLPLHPSPQAPPHVIQPGKISFGTIPTLSDNWWQNGVNGAFPPWDQNTLYVWGANIDNYAKNDPTQNLDGGGMASATGPSKGRGHPNYVGIVTTSLDKPENDAVFSKLESDLQNNKNIVFPMANNKFGLGTGIAYNWFNSDNDWKESQKYLLNKIDALISQASQIEFEGEPFWPDCSVVADCKKVSAQEAGTFSLVGSKSFQRIGRYLDLTTRFSDIARWKFPNDQNVQRGPEAHYNLAQSSAHISIPFSASILVLFKNPNGSFDVLTDKASDGRIINIQANLKGGQSWYEGAIQALANKTGINLSESDLFYLHGGNKSIKPTDSNTDFFVVLTGNKPAGHTWTSLETIFSEISDQTSSFIPDWDWLKRLFPKDDITKKYNPEFREQIKNFCENVAQKKNGC